MRFVSVVRWCSLLLVSFSFAETTHVSPPITHPRTQQDKKDIEPVIGVFMNRACGGCHRETTARQAFANFTIEGGEREFLKSLAYRHYSMRARVQETLGKKAFTVFPKLESASIDPFEKGAPLGSFERFLENITRDGDAVSDKDREIVKQWFEKGAPLPKDILDEVYEEIRELVRVIK